MEDARRYHIEIDLSQKNTSHAQLIRLTGRNKKVLEIGPATGYVTKLLQERGCRVWCIENDPEAASVAAAFCERMVIANVETIDFLSTFPDDRFNVITFGDVLEHLVDPLGVLMRVKDVLQQGGYVVASVPNVAHASIRLSLLRGRFDYVDMGLLDRTHLRFFTQESLAKLFHDAGYDVGSWRRVLADPFATEMQLKEEDYPPWLSQAARGDLEGLTYQIVVKAYPARSGRNGRSTTSFSNESGRNLVDDLWRWQNEQNALHEADLHAKEDALTQVNAEAASLARAIVDRDETITVLHRELDSIRESSGYKILAAYRRLARRLFPADSWRGASYRLLVNLAKRAANVARGRREPRGSSRDENGRNEDDRH